MVFLIFLNEALLGIRGQQRLGLVTGIADMLLSADPKSSFVFGLCLCLEV